MKIKKRIYLLAGVFLISISFFLVFPQNSYASSETRIHFLSLNTTTDAILLESNGHFGMIDSGEDWDYPDGSNPKYPLRSGITTGIGFEQQVIHYLNEIGVEKLDFYIATHSHSDHIGTGDEILSHFPTEKLYINRYDDSYMLDAHGTDPSDPYYVADAQENRLWDNQYVYDQLISAAKDNGTQIITDLDLEENASLRTFSLGDMTLEIMNYERLRDENGNIIPVSSENNNCLVVKITAYDKVALLTSDMEPLDGDTAKIAQQLIHQLGDSSENTATSINSEQLPEPVLPEFTEDSILDLPEKRCSSIDSLTKAYTYSLSTTTEEDNSCTEEIDESQPNTGATISLDLMKMVHHSVDYNNTTYFLTSLNPKTVVVTAPMSWYSSREKALLPDSAVFATASDSAAVVSTFTESEITTSYTTLSPGWETIDDMKYYFDQNGRTLSKGTHIIDGKLYYFNQKGDLVTKGWIQDGNTWYYCIPESQTLAIGWYLINDDYYFFYDSGEMASDTMIGDYYVDINGRWIPGYIRDGWIRDGQHWLYRKPDGSYFYSTWANINGNWYYFDSNGWMLTDWNLIDGNWYYMYDSGAKATDTWIDDYYVDQNGIWIPGWPKPEWINCNGKWWYRHSDGSYTRSNWETINGLTYYFDSDGWMVTGWLLYNNHWYYLDTNGVMQQNTWYLIKGKYYYFYSNGQMASNTWINNDYVDINGIWIPNYRNPEWILSNNKWWYRHADGSYTRSDWEKINGKWYYFDANGWMKTGWLKLGNTWYYLTENGDRVESCWKWINDKCYYFYSNGSMASNTTIDGYYVDASGAWIP